MVVPYRLGFCRDCDREFLRGVFDVTLYSCRRQSLNYHLKIIDLHRIVTLHSKRFTEFISALQVIQI